MEAFASVKNLIDDLWIVFGDTKNISSLSLYRRLISKLNPKDESDKTILRVLDGFKEFFTNHLENLKADKLPKDAVIRFATTNVCIEIQKFMHKGSPETRHTIKEHLLTINALLSYSDEDIKALETETAKKSNVGMSKEDEDISNKLKEDTTEDVFVKNIITKTVKAMDSPQATNPLAGVMGLLQSGVITELVDGLQNKKGKKQMDVGKLMGSMQTAIGVLMPRAEEKGPKIEELKEEKKEVNKEEKKEEIKESKKEE